MADTKGFDFAKIANNEFEIFGNKGVIDSNKRVLIIGLGGTGTDTLLATKDTILNRFQLKDKKLPDNIKLLALDTDEGILKKSRGTTKIASSEFVLLNDANISANLHDKSKMPDFFKNWVNPSLMIPDGAKVGVKGAGGIRQIGRYLLISNYKKIYDAVSSHIKSVMTAAPGGTVTDIIILSGISGGTGSGTFIDMGYIVRKVCNDLVIGSLQKQITAYLYLPDVNLGNPDVPSDAYDYIKCNGYAALKDLDYFTSIPHKKQVSAVGDAEKPYKFMQKYGHSQKEIIESEDAPFDATYLISGVPDTISPVKDAYEYSINITADSIVNFIAGSDDKTGHAVTDPGVEAVDINGAAMVATNPFIKRADGTNLLGNYDYKIIGAGVASLPMKEITDYIAGEFLKKVDILKNQKPMAEDFQKLYKTVGLGIQRLAENVYKMIGNLNAAVTGDDFVNNAASNKNILAKNLSQYFNNAKTNIPGYTDMVVSTLETALTTQIDDAFVDINKGPFFANALMAEPQKGVIAQLVSISTELLNRANAFSSEASKIHVNAENTLASVGSFFGKAKKYQQYIDEKISECRSMIYSEICKELADKINNATRAFGKPSLVDRIRQKNRSVYDVYTQILDTLAKRFGNDGTKVNTKNMGRVFVWDIVEIGDVAPDIKNRIGTMDLDKALNNLLDDMVKNSQKWCDSSTTLNEFGEFLNSQFQTILGESMDVFLSSLDEASLQGNIKKLDGDAKVHFPSNSAIESAASNIYDKVTVPANAPKLNSAIITYLQNHHHTLKEPELSMLYERISWVRVCIGVPIFQYAYLQSYEEAYENVDPNHKQGMHLYENVGVHGKDYPALLPDVYWEHGYKNRREQARYERMSELFEKAEKLELVGYSPSSAYIIMTPSDWIDTETDSVLAKYNLTRDSIKSLCLTVNEIRSCIADLNEIKNKKVSETHIYIPDTAEGPMVRHYAKESFCKMPEAEAVLRNEIDKRQKLDDIVNDMEDALKSFGEEKDIYMAFVYSFAFDIIRSQGAKCVYSVDSDVVELSNKFNDKFWRYTTFKEFERVIYPMEKDSIAQKISEASDSNEQLLMLSKTCRNTAKEMNFEIKEAAFLGNDEKDAEIKSFYNKLRMFLADEINKFKSIGITE